MADDLAERVARMFHEEYERLAPSHGYETRKASAKPWEAVPENNRALMVATADHVLDRLGLRRAVETLKEGVRVGSPPLPFDACQKALEFLGADAGG